MCDSEARQAREQGKARNEEINGELKRALEEMVIWRKKLNIPSKTLHRIMSVLSENMNFREG